MKFKSLFILLFAAVWGIASWWWYTCKIKGFCGAQLQSAISNTLPATQDLVPDSAEQQESANDTDQDGIPDETERKLGLNENSTDSDQDGVNDLIELGDPTTPLDTDDDGIINALDKDDDGDGYPTSEEDVDPNGDGDVSDAHDSNYDGIPDYMDSNSNWGTRDDDGDGISNAEEKALGTNTALTDSDADGVPDATEINQTPMDTDGDGIIDALDDDDDNDGIPTAEESPDPNNDGNIDDALDSDGNGVPDYLQAAVLDSSIGHEATDDPPKTEAIDTTLLGMNTEENSTITDVFEGDGSKSHLSTDDTNEAGDNQQNPIDKAVTSNENETDKLTREMLAIAQQKIDNQSKADETASAKVDETNIIDQTTESQNQDKTDVDQDSTVKSDENDADENQDSTVKSDENDADENQDSIAKSDENDADENQDSTVKSDENDADKNQDSTVKPDENDADENNVTLAKDIEPSTGNDSEKNSLSPAKLYFPFRSSKTTLASSVIAYIDEVKQYLKTNPKARIKVTGHTDNVGSARNNKKLGLKRAEMVRDILIENGVSSTQIIIESQGEAQPISDNKTEAGRKLNRRVELKPLPYKE